jgi:hypothetical protein
MRTRARLAFDSAYCDRQTHPLFYQILDSLQVNNSKARRALEASI